MPIVQHTYEFSEQGDGSRSNVVRMYDQDGTEYATVFPSPEGFDVESRIQTMIVEMDVQLAEQEFQTLVGI